MNYLSRDMKCALLAILVLLFVAACSTTVEVTGPSAAGEQAAPPAPFTVEQQMERFRAQLQETVQQGTLASIPSAYSFCTGAFEQVEHPWNEEEKAGICRVTTGIWVLPKEERSAEMICTSCKRLFDGVGAPACARDEQLGDRASLCVNQVVDLYNAYEANNAVRLEAIRKGVQETPTMSTNAVVSKCSDAAYIVFESWWNQITPNDRADICSAAARYFDRSGKSIREECEQTQYPEQCVNLLEELFVRTSG